MQKVTISKEICRFCSMKYLGLVFFFFWIGLVNVISQTGGTTVFPFIDFNYDARSGALGRHFITAYENDVNLGVNNPALWNEEMHRSIGFNQSLHAAGINHGKVTYAQHFGDVGTGAIHMRYLAYGRMDRTNENGDVIGTFSAGDFMLGAGFGRRVNPNLSIGANVNLIWSHLDAFNSVGFSVDMGGIYLADDERTQVSALVRNAGAQFSTYFPEQERQPLPVNPMLAVAHKLEHAPFRFSIVAHSLNRWDLTYLDPNAQPSTDPLTGEVVPVETAGFGEQLARHFIYQLEILGGELMRVRLAFDYQRRRELLVPNRPGMAGFSTGLGFNFHRFSIDYGLVIFSSAGFSNLFTFRTNFDKWKS